MDSNHWKCTGQICLREKQERRGADTRQPVVNWIPGPPSGASAGLLWVLSDQRVRFCLDGGRSSGETRRLHKHAVARRAAEVRSALDSAVVLPCGEIH